MSIEQLKRNDEDRIQKRIFFFVALSISVWSPRWRLTDEKLNRIISPFEFILSDLVQLENLDHRSWKGNLIVSQLNVSSSLLQRNKRFSWDRRQSSLFNNLFFDWSSPRWLTDKKGRKSSLFCQSFRSREDLIDLEFLTFFFRRCNHQEKWAFRFVMSKSTRDDC